MFSRSDRSEKAAVAPRSSSEDGTYVQDPAAVVYDSDLPVECPPHTTERRLVNKIDFHVIPFLCVLYLLAFLDRVNIANANVFGLSEDLGLASKDSMKYNAALAIFFAPYVLFEVPSNVLLKRFKPSVWLSGCMFLFGLVTMLQGLVQNYSGLLATRFFLGLFESGMFPGCFYVISSFYTRREAQRRYSFFFSSTTLAGAFGGLLASAIGKMDGMRGYRGWRWIFILEGLLTVVVSSILFFFTPNFPEDAKWLSEDEKLFHKARLAREQGNSAIERQITASDVGRVFKDIKVWVGAFMYFGLIVPAYGYAYFSPTIIKSYGYSPIQTQLHSVPPWAAAFGLAMIVAYLSDKLQHRLLFTLLPIAVAMAGFGILIRVHDNVNLQYAALFLVAMGCYSAMPVIVCWFNMNLGGHHRRSVGSAWQVGFGNLGGLIAIFAYLSRDGPEYIPGHSICIAFICFSALNCVCYWVLCSWSNRKRDKTPTDLGLTEYEKTEMGDLNPDYRYLL